MKIALISEYNFLTTTGGTEHYTAMLAAGLVKQGIELQFISRGCQENDTIEKEVICEFGSYLIHLLPNSPFAATEIRQDTISHTWPHIKKILVSFQPDIIHIHTLSTFFNIKHIEKCNKYFQHIIFTSHIPGHFCLKGDMIRNNSSPCIGYIGFQCNLCLLTTDFKKGVASLLKGYVGKKKNQLSQFHNADIHIVCTSQWQRRQLHLNGYPDNKLSVIRQALQVHQLNPIDILQKNKGKFRVGYLGRLSPEKGTSLLFHLLTSFRNQNDFEFVLGIPANSDEVELRNLKCLADESNTSIKIYHHINSSNKKDFFNEIDILLIPSFWLETGPIVLLEAIYYDKIILAPNTGGPLEFAAEYPQLVRTYEWNNAADLVRLLWEVKSAELKTTVDYKALLKDKESQFIKDHIDLYSKKIKRL